MDTHQDTFTGKPNCHTLGKKCSYIKDDQNVDVYRCKIMPRHLAPWYICKRCGWVTSPHVQEKGWDWRTDT